MHTEIKNDKNVVKIPVSSQNIAESLRLSIRKFWKLRRWIHVLQVSMSHQECSIHRGVIIPSFRVTWCCYSAAK